MSLVAAYWHQDIPEHQSGKQTPLSVAVPRGSADGTAAADCAPAAGSVCAPPAAAGKSTSIRHRRTSGVSVAAPAAVPRSGESGNAKREGAVAVAAVAGQAREISAEAFPVFGANARLPGWRKQTQPVVALGSTCAKATGPLQYVVDSRSAAVEAGTT